MHFHLADNYEDTGSLLHRIDPRVKVIVTVALILLISLTPMGAFGAYLGFFALMMTGAVVSRVDPLLVVKRSLVALVFAGASVTLIFTMPAPYLGTVPVVGWPVSGPGIIRFLSIMFKSTLSVQAAVLLVVSTQFTDMLWALGALKIPPVLVSIISFMYRYIFVLAEEALRLTRARDSRSATLPGGNKPSLWFRAQTTGRMIGNLLVRSFGRSERVYQAMVSRGYCGELLMLSTPQIQRRDVLFALPPLAVGLSLLVVSLVL